MQINIKDIKENFENIKNTEGYPRLKKLLLINVVVWLLFLTVLNAAFLVRENSLTALNDTDMVLRGAMQISAYPVLKSDAQKGGEPLTIVSAILDKLGLQGRVAQLASASSGSLALQVNRLYADELEALLKEIKDNGLAVNTAEIRALTSNQDGRLLNFNMTVEN